MKDAMKQLEEVEAELAEFFCEDNTSFRLDECYKSLNGFFNKFKKVKSYLTYWLKVYTKKPLLLLGRDG